ncbi:MAG: UDP-3-O-(3-hydroxymyristoyl)glucosamine N-acyltransferase [Puniceicoccales bacterium]|jgi:UDP-3-O-[3-hydroxymyristoyl] glucosamine N-acyltransferase|nr:UDP-3-O-(3-hydroxymyristoyl)glucosamine N-acyltransferase [Puniceicoccales bacterium]
MSIAFSLKELASIAMPVRRVDGEGTEKLTTVCGIAALDEAGEGDLSFLGNRKYTALVASTAASVVLLPEDYLGAPRMGQVFFFVQDPSSVIAKVCARIEEQLWQRPLPGIHPTAIVDPSAKLGKNLHIGAYCIIEAGATIGDNAILEPYCLIGREARIGADSWLKARVTVAEYCVTGERVKLFVGAVIGGEGFGFETVAGTHRKIPQVGNVVLEDDVEVGANSTIDRARFATTHIGAGTKIDNLVQIGHNCRVGKHCILVSQSGMAGSTVLEDYVMLAGQAGLAGHLRIGHGARIGAQCGVLSDVPAGATMLDSPAIPIQQAKKLMILKQRLPDLFKRVKALEKYVGTSSEAGSQATS